MTVELVEFLHGERDSFHEEDYLMNGGWVVLTMMPLMVAVVAITLRAAGHIPPLGSAQGITWDSVWGGIGGGLAGATFQLVQQDRLTPWVRLAGGAGLTLLGFGLFFLGLYFFNHH